MATDTASNKPIGTISSVTGQARIIGADGTVRPAVAGDKIFMREMVFTTANATVQIQLENGQTVNVAADSEYVAGLEGSGGAAAALDQAAQKGAVAAGGVPGPSLLGSKVIGTIKDMVGEVKVTSADGTVRTAQVGDKVYAGETVASSVTGPVSIALEGGGTLQCDPGATLSLTPGILALAGQKPATDLAAIQAAIAAGADPTQVADATAAGGAPAAGGSEDGGGGHSFILLNQADSEGFVTAGFNTIGAGIGFPSPYYELAFFPSGNTVPVFPPATARVSEEGLSGGLPDSVGDQDTTNSATASGVNNIVDQEGGALSFTLSAPAEALTSDGQPIVWTGGGTNTLVGSVGESTIITITIDNLGNYNVTLSGSIDQPDLTVEDEISFEVGVTVDDGTNSTDSTITITVEDDAPVAHPDSTDVPEDAALVTYNVLANDELGSDGGHLTSASSTNPNITINGVTPEGDITFTVARGYEGPIVIDYVVTDHDGDHQTSQLTVNVGPDSTPSVAPVVKANDTQVYESALPDGSGGGSTSTDGSFEIDTGNDALARFEIQGANGAWIDVTGGGSVQGAYGTLLISVVDGAYTWTYTIGDNTLDHTDTSTADGDSDRGIADNLLDPFQIRVSDDDGDTSPEANLTIKVADDGPSIHIVADDATVVEGNTVSGDWDRVAGADGGVVKVVVGGTEYNLGDEIATGKGTLVVNSDGSWSFSANDDLDNDLVQSVSFTLKLTDGDLDTVSDNLTITITDGAGPTLGEANSVALSVDEDDLPAGSDTAKESLADASVLTFTAGSDSIDSIVFGATGGIAISGLDEASTVTWASSADGRTLTGSIGETEVIVLNLSGAASVAAGGEGDVTVTATLLADFPHQDVENASAVSVSGIQVVGADDDGDVATATASVVVVDDAPTARDDSDAVAAGDYGPVTGNVMTDASAGDAGDADVNAADTEGADSAAVSAVSGFGGSDSSFDEGGNLVVNGQYGVLTINAEGDYSYLRNQGTPGGKTDTFTYTLTDADGDSDTANLVITIANSGTDLDLPTFDENGTLVNEKGLPARTGESEGTGEQAAAGTDGDQSETTAGTISFNAEDGPPVVTIDGTVVSGTIGQQFVHPTVGTLTVTSYSYDAASGDGSIGYSYTLTDNTSGDATTDTFTVKVADQDGDSSTSPLVIRIADDAPIANADTDGVIEGVGHLATGNVVFGGTDAGDANATDGVADVPGADSFNGAVVGVAAGDTDATLVSDATVGTAITGAYGKLTLNADGSYSYDPNENIHNPDPVLDVFTYTIRDGDGDLRSTTLTISIEDGAGPSVTGVVALTVDEDDLPDGSDTSKESVSDNDALTFTAGSDAIDSIVFGDTSGITIPGLNGGESVVWTASSEGRTLTGAIDGVDVIRLDLSGAATVAAGTSGVTTVTATLLNEFPHEDVADADSLTIGGIKVVGADDDGESATATATVTVIDDEPITDNEGSLATVDDEVVGYTIFNGVNTLLTGDVFGADGAGSPSITILGPGSLGGNVVISGSNLVYTSGHDVAPDGTEVETFTYQIKDADGDTRTAIFQVTLTDSGPSINQVAAQVDVDEEGLGGNPDAVVSGDLEGEATFAEGALFGLDFGEDGVGDIVLTAVEDTGLRTLAGNAIKTTWNLETHTLTGEDAVTGEDVFTLQITNVATGEYRFDLLKPVQHSDPTSEDDAPAEGPLEIGVTVTDSEGDEATGVITVAIDDDTPIAVFSPKTGAEIRLDETDNDADDNDVGGVLATRTVTVGSLFDDASLFGADTAAVSGSKTYALTLSASGADSGLDDVLTGNGLFLFKTVAGVIEAREGTDASDAASGDVAFTIGIDADTGSVTVTQSRAIKHNDAPTDHDENDDPEIMTAGLVEVELTVKDRDGDTHADKAELGSLIKFEDDGPGFGTLAVAVAADITHDETAGVQTGSGQDDTAESLPGAFTGIVGTLIGSAQVTSGGSLTGSAAYGTDADGGTTVVNSYKLTTSGNGAFSGVATNLAVTDGDPIYLFTSGDLVLGVEGNAVDGSGAPTGAVAFALYIDGSGTVTLAQYLAIDHGGTEDPSQPDEAISLLNASLSELIHVTANVTVTDGDGDQITQDFTSSAALTVTFEDDGPAAIDPDHAFVVNRKGIGGNPGDETLNVRLDIDSNIHDNMGIDQGGTLTFAVENGSPSDFTSALKTIYLYLADDGRRLVGSTFSGGVDGADPDVLDEQVFVIQLNLDGGLSDEADAYSFKLYRQIDGGVGKFTVNDAGYDPEGGNTAYSYFDDTILDGGDQDVLLTPMLDGDSIGSTNLNANTFGISGGNSIGSTPQGLKEAVRVDYVEGIGGTPPSNKDYEDVGGSNHVFTGHNLINGASLVVSNVNDTTTIRAVARFDDDSGTDNVVGSGVEREITSVQIQYGLNVLGQPDVVWVDKSDGDDTYTVGGSDFTVTWGSLDVVIGGVMTNTTLAIFTDLGLNSAEWWYDAGDTFKVSGFGASTFEPGSAVDIQFDLKLTDGDGDNVIITDGINVQLSPDDHVIHEGTEFGDTLDYTNLPADEAVTLIGLEGDDALLGDDGNDILIGGKDNDTLSGGAGDDTFKWLSGDQGIVGNAAEDEIEDWADGNDKLDLSDLLQGDLQGALSTAGNLAEYLHFSSDGVNTTLEIKSGGGFSDDTTTGPIGGADQVIYLSGDLVGGNTTQSDVIASLLQAGKLITD